MRIIFVLIITIFTIMGFTHTHQEVITKSQDPKGFAVIELFTSEGCSSCPPADEAVSAINNEYKSNVFVIGFHVDYWNALGWKDIFSNALYTERQKHYADIFALNSIYTPQVVVNGTSEFVGSDKKRLQDAVNSGLNKSVVSAIVVNAKANGSNMVNVDYTIKPNTNEILNVVLVQLHAQSDVKRGENGGKILHHINVARDFKTVSAGNDHGNISLSVPSGLTAKDCSVIAYLQDKKSWHITSAAIAKVD